MFIQTLAILRRETFAQIEIWRYIKKTKKQHLYKTFCLEPFLLYITEKPLKGWNIKELKASITLKQDESDFLLE